MERKSSEEPLTALRHKFAEDLEEILQCKVCFDSLSIPIPLCLQGHHVCRSCQFQMPTCPFCKSDFKGTRNYLAETLIVKFDEIKTSLIENRTSQRTVVSNSTQTDFSPNEPAAAMIVEETNKLSPPVINYKVAPIVGKGKYPCKIGNCKEELVHGRMLPHLRFYHEEELVEEKSTKSSLYENIWQFSYQIPNALDRAIMIPNMGIFFLNVSIDDKGDLCGNLQIVNTRIIAQQFEYSLEVKTGHSSIAYKGQVLGTRISSKNINENSLFISNVYLQPLLKKKKIFNVHLVLNRIFDDFLKKNE
ncbi:hypothetical protein TSAR_014553 [Trichomalopsis sarcophagae]|uniref:RING-type domain-containing protein n=1 Tax=Trichomalopsis sarcophagae TaxID=543379 RepID=A0A232F774_9HYME|nr:hypothetical protein TSAR_014553 [Trichomalopsis sarcophagae]